MELRERGRRSCPKWGISFLNFFFSRPSRAAADGCPGVGRQHPFFSH